MLYPLLFQPIFKEHVWGGRTLEPLYGKQLPPDVPVGESWEISDRPEGASVVANGPLAGKDLRWLMEHHAAELLGSARPSNGRFPLLVKILDCRQAPSVQVHPPGDAAQRLGGEPKTEVWYITQADPDARLTAGLLRGVKRGQFERKLGEGRVLECLHTIPVRSGDAMLVPSGTDPCDRRGHRPVRDPAELEHHLPGPRLGPARLGRKAAGTSPSAGPRLDRFRRFRARSRAKSLRDQRPGDEASVGRNPVVRSRGVASAGTESPSSARPESASHLRSGERQCDGDRGRPNPRSRSGPVLSDSRKRFGCNCRDRRRRDLPVRRGNEPGRRRGAARGSICVGSKRHWGVAAACGRRSGRRDRGGKSPPSAARHRPERQSPAAGASGRPRSVRGAQLCRDYASPFHRKSKSSA